MSDSSRKTMQSKCVPQQIGELICVIYESLRENRELYKTKKCSRLPTHNQQWFCYSCCVVKS